MLDTAQGVDVFNQLPRPQVDSLWVIDGSASMGAAQERLIPIALHYLDALDELDVSYQIGVIRPDLSDPEGPILHGEPWIITPSTQNADLAFLNNLNVGAGDAGTNQGMAAALEALTPPLSAEENRGFSRNGAALEVVFITDSDDSSRDSTTGLTLDPEAAFRTLETLQAGAPLRVSALAGPVPDGCDSGDVQANPAPRYLELIEESGGALVSLCDMDGGDLLPSDDIPERLRRFELTQVPSSSELSVWVDELPLPSSAYTLSDNILTFLDGSVPDYDSAIRVTYVYELEETP